MLAAADGGRRAVAEITAGTAGRLTIGAAPAVSTYVLPAVFQQFRDEHPGVQLSVRSGHSEEVLEMVRREEVAVGLMRPIPDPEVTPDAALRGPAAARRASRAPVRLLRADPAQRAARRAPHPLRPDEQLPRAHVGIFRQAGIDPLGYLEVDNIDAAKRMVEQRLGIALLPATSVTAEIGTGRLFPVVVADMAPVRRQIVVARRRDVEPTPSSRASCARWRRCVPIRSARTASLPSRVPT